MKRALYQFMLGALLAGASSFAQEASPSESQVEAAFLYQFGKFVNWPAESFTGPDSPVVIGIFGEDPIAADLEAVVGHKTIDGRPVKIEGFDPKTDTQALQKAGHCHILLIGMSEKRRLAEILNALKGTSVLTVSKIDGFTDSGGIIGFFLKEKKVRFEINHEAAKRAGLKISAKLLMLARKKDQT